MRAARPLALPVLLGAIFALGCLNFPSDDALYYQALDYRLDRPRLLALALSPTVMTAGQELSFEALILGPGQGELDSAVWKSCGLGLDGSVSFYDLACFSDDLEVEEIATGNPTTWTPPEPGGCSDTGWGCYSSFPFLLEASFGGQELRGAFFAQLHSSVEQVDAAPSWRALPLTLTAGEARDGVMSLEAWLGAEADGMSFRWYVDDGTLLDTGRTTIQGTRDGGMYTTNRWELPAGEGPWRVVVVVSSDDGYGVWADTGFGLPGRDGDEDADWFAWSELPNMTWAILTVEAP